jgi:hypothetical protein
MTYLVGLLYLIKQGIVPIKVKATWTFQGKWRYFGRQKNCRKQECVQYEYRYD